jgi:hypothetical protein
MSGMKDDYRIPEQRCPECAYELTGAGGFPGSEERAPRPGDWTVCINCGAALCFGKDLRLRIAAPGELDREPLAVRRDIAQIRASIRMLQRRN